MESSEDWRNESKACEGIKIDQNPNLTEEEITQRILENQRPKPNHILSGLLKKK